MAVDKTAKEFSIIDIAVHNACKCTFKSEIETDFDTYKDVFDVNYFGALRFVKSIIPYMTAKKKGKVIFTSSAVGVTGFMNISPYSSTKGALEALAKCLRIEYAKDNITFHIIHPPLHKQNRLLHYRCLMNLRHLQKKLVMVLRNILIQRDT